MTAKKDTIDQDEEEFRATVVAAAAASAAVVRRPRSDRRSKREKPHRHPLPRSHRPREMQKQQQQQQQQQQSCPSSTSSHIHLRRVTLGQRRIARKPELKRKLHNMSIKLSPLVQVTTGLVHPAFPRSMLQFWLLTDAQLEDMAWFYHQRPTSTPTATATPTAATTAVTDGRRGGDNGPGWSSSSLRTQYPCPITWGPDLTLEDKRRKIGKFIGLRGCETPHWLLTEEEIAEEARRARLADEEEMWKRKMHPGRF